MSGFDLGRRRASEFRHRAFWALFAERHPAERERRARHGPWFWQRGLADLSLVVTMYVAPEPNLVGVFFGRNGRLGAIDPAVRLAPHRADIEASLGLRPDQRFSPDGLGSIWRVNCFAEDNWPAMADWMVTEATRFERAAVDALAPR